MLRNNYLTLTLSLLVTSSVVSNVEATPTHTVILHCAPGVRPADNDHRPNSFEVLVDDPRARIDADRVEHALAALGVARVAPAFDVAPRNKALARRLGLDRMYRIDLPLDASAAMAVTLLNEFPTIIELAERDGVGSVMGELIPADPLFPTQWNLKNTGQIVQGTPGMVGVDISATEAWTITTGSRDVTLAVLDTGIDPHLEFSGRLVQGWNTILNNNQTGDWCPHGTSVAGVAVATGNNCRPTCAGIAGVDWEARLMPIVVADPGCDIAPIDASEGIVWATDEGADVINMSFIVTPTQMLHQTIIYARESGVTLVAASGNQDPTIPYPAKWPETIAVNGHTNIELTFGTSGPEVTLSAPGQGVPSVVGLDSYNAVSGTSFAAPHVAATVCLMLSVDPTLSPDDIEYVLSQTAIDAGVPGKDVSHGFGRLDANCTLIAVRDGFATPGDMDGDQDVDQSDVQLLLDAWGPCPQQQAGACPNCRGDFDRNNEIDFDDLLFLLSQG